MTKAKIVSLASQLGMTQAKIIAFLVGTHDAKSILELGLKYFKNKPLKIDQEDF